MTVLKTSDLVLPDEIIDPWLTKIGIDSAVSNLSKSTPQKFGVSKSMTFNIGEAELVEEGQNKDGSTTGVTVKTVRPHKFQKTVRMTDEVLWADEDDQMGVVQDILGQIQPALSRALDFGVFHGINPATGAPADSIPESLYDTPNSVEIGNNAAYTYLDEADKLVLASQYLPRDIAIDPIYAGAFSTLRGQKSEQRLYPNFRLDVEVSELDNHRASVSQTVGAGGVIPGGSGVAAFVGDFSGIRWGIQRQIGLELIQYGDPDGGGDLKRNNQVAFRAEVVYGWGIADTKAFAKIEYAELSGS